MNSNDDLLGTFSYKPGDIFSNYWLQESLGGSEEFGKTFKAVRETDNKIVVIKIFPELSEWAKKLYEIEIKAYELTKGMPGVLELIDSGEVNRNFYTVTDFISDGTLRNLFQKYPEGMGIDEVLMIFEPIAKSIDQIHARNIIHRDLKPENILLHKTNDIYETFITDFGLAKFTNDSKSYRTETIAGTLSYIAPEAWIPDTSITSAIDIYSFGLMLYEVLEGKKPFASDNPLEVLNKSIPYPEKTRQRTNEKVVEHILRALSRYPEERPLSAAGVIDNIRIAYYGRLIESRGWVGRHFKNYVVVDLLGKGKMGTSLLAKDISTNVQYVLKGFEKNTLAGNAKLIFEKELESLQRLEEGYHVLTPRELFEENDILFIVTDYKEGGNLRNLLESSEDIELEEILDIFTQIAKAIDYIHSRNIVHRDIKPENIVYDYADNDIQVFLIDFGISEVLDNTRSSFSTSTIAGTYYYMAPELWQPNTSKTKAIDIYAFGIMLYEALEGRLPFEAEFPAIMNQHINAPIPLPKKTIRDWGDEIGRLLLKPLAKNVNERPKSAYEFIIDFKRAINNSSLQKFTTQGPFRGSISKLPLTWSSCSMYLAFILLALTGYSILNSVTPGVPNFSSTKPFVAILVFSILLLGILVWRNISVDREFKLKEFTRIRDVAIQLANKLTAILKPLPKKEIVDDKKIRLRQDFHYLHEPISFIDNDSSINKYYLARYIEHEKSEEEKFTNHLFFSKGGAFLLAGYRGVGKTSFVNKAIYDLKQKLNKSESAEVVDIHLSLARHVSPTYLMFLVIQNLYFRLKEKNILNKLQPSLQEEILLAYQRTLMNIGGKVNQNSEYGLSLADVQAMGISSKIGIGLKKSKGKEVSSSFLPYDDKQAEYDLISLSRKLLDGYSDPSNLYIKNLYHLIGIPIKNIQIKIICVLDELDKLDDLPQAKEEKESKVSSDNMRKDKESDLKKTDPNHAATVFEIISALKNVFTTSGITFIFIAGKGLHEKVIEDVRHGESIYESVFAFDKYLPVLWSKSEAICSRIMEKTNGNTNKEIIEKFIKYLDFEGRGIPRKILRTFNKYVSVDDIGHILDFTRADARRIRFYAKLLDDIKQKKIIHSINGRDDIEVGKIDKQLLSTFYLIDWIFQQGSNSFTIKDVENAGQELNQNILLSPNKINEISENLIKILKKHKYIEQIQAQTLYSMEQVSIPQYIVSQRNLAELGTNAIENGKMLFGIPGNTKENKIGDYRLLEHLSTNSLTDIYRARDIRTQNDVALKVMKKTFLAYEKQIRNEEKLLLSLNHPNLVRCYPHNKTRYEEIEDYPFIVMDYVEGVSLASVIPSMGFDNYVKAVNIFKPLVEVVNYLHQQNIVRCDIKPSNTVLTKDGRVLLIDLGTAKYIDDQQEDDRIIGTPAYISPEQISGLCIDIKSDIYSLGILLVELLTGSVPFEGESDYDILSLRRKSPNPFLGTLENKQETLVPQQVITIVHKCIEEDPAKRFNNAAELLQSLNELPTENLSDFIVDIIENHERFKESENFKTAELDASYFSFVEIAPEPSSRRDKVEEIISRPGLKVSIPHQNDQYISLKGMNEYLLGRSKHADLRPEFPSEHLFMSRYNAVIREEDGEYVIYDLNSLNGTRINGEPIGRHTLVNRDSIEISDNVSIRFFN